MTADPPTPRAAHLNELLAGATVGSRPATVDDLLTAPCGHCSNHAGEVGKCWHGTIACCLCGRILPRSVRRGRPPLMLNRGWEWPVEPSIQWWRDALAATDRATPREQP